MGVSAGHPLRLGVSFLLLAALADLDARASTWTWTGLGDDDNWSTPANWSPAGPPHSDNDTTLIFDGSRRPTPQQDVCGKFLFGGLVFTNTAGVFILGGTTNVAALDGCKSWQFSGSQRPFIRVLTTNAVALAGPLLAVDGTSSSPKTSLVEVAAGGLLQLPTICGGLGDVVTKRGNGVVRVCETNDGLRYACNDTSVGPEWRIEDGTVEMGVRTDRFLFATGDTEGTNWVRAAAHTKCSNSLVVGDGVGDAASAVLRLIGPDQSAQLLDNNLSITVNADGLLDLDGMQDWCRNSDDPLRLTVSNGQVRLGGSSLYVRNGRVLDLRGGARIDGTGSSAIRFYDGATNLVDGLATCAVVAADAALVRADNAMGVVFQVSGRTGDTAALEITGHLGAGGAGSHLVKRGPGTMAIGDLTHAVRTNRVEEGTLLIRGVAQSGAAGAQWLVASNATLGGAGTISNATVVVQGGTIDPGDATAGTLTIASDLALVAGATLAFDLTPADPVSGRTADQLVIRNGVLTGLTNATLRLDVQPRADVDGKTFRVISGGGDYTGASFGAVALTGTSGRRAVVDAGDGYVDVTIQNLMSCTVVIVR